MTKHTPGPWDFSKVPTAFVIKSGKFSICRMSITPLSQRSAEAVADARLISAAPDMLAVLQEMSSRQHSDIHADDMAMINAAIAKATGGAA